MLARKAVLPRDAAAPEAASWGSSADRAHGFAAIDQWLEQRGESALAVAYAADLEACEALAEHAARRLSARCAVARASGGLRRKASASWRDRCRAAPSRCSRLATSRSPSPERSSTQRSAQSWSRIRRPRGSRAPSRQSSRARSPPRRTRSRKTPPNAQVLWVVPRASAEASRVGREPGRAWLTFEVEGALAEGDVGRWWEVARGGSAGAAGAHHSEGPRGLVAQRARRGRCAARAALHVACSQGARAGGAGVAAHDGERARPLSVGGRRARGLGRRRCSRARARAGPVDRAAIVQRGRC
jgi:hypothetical protein